MAYVFIMESQLLEYLLRALLVEPPKLIFLFSVLSSCKMLLKAV